MKGILTSFAILIWSNSIAQIEFDLSKTLETTKVQKACVVTEKDSTIYEFDNNIKLHKKAVFEYGSLSEFSSYKYDSDTTYTVTELYNTKTNKRKSKDKFKSLGDKVLAYSVEKEGELFSVLFEKNKFGLDSIQTTLLNDTIVVIKEYTYSIDKDFEALASKLEKIPTQKLYREYLIDRIVYGYSELSDLEVKRIKEQKYDLSAKGDTLSMGTYRNGKKSVLIEIVNQNEMEVQIMYLGEKAKIEQIISPLFNEYRVMV